VCCCQLINLPNEAMEEGNERVWDSAEDDSDSSVLLLDDSDDDCCDHKDDDDERCDLDQDNGYNAGCDQNDDNDDDDDDDDENGVVDDLDKDTSGMK